MKEGGLGRVQALLGYSWRSCTTSAHTQAARGQEGYCVLELAHTLAVSEAPATEGQKS